MWAYVDEVRRLERRFRGLQLEHIHWADNFLADELSKLAAKGGPFPPGVFMERLTEPSVTIPTGNGALSTPTSRVPGARPSRGARPDLRGRDSIPEKHSVAVVEGASPPWVVEILRYLRNRDLPEDDKQADRVVQQASLY